MKIGIFRKGKAIYDQETGYIIAAPHRRQRAFQRQLRRSSWGEINPGERYEPVGRLKGWKAPQPIPDWVRPNEIHNVYVMLSVFGQIKAIHWTNNETKAKRRFRRLGYKLLRR